MFLRLSIGDLIITHCWKLALGPIRDVDTFLLNQSNRNAFFFPEKNKIMTSKYLYLSENLFMIDRVFGRLLSRDFQSENVGVI